MMVLAFSLSHSISCSCLFKSIVIKTSLIKANRAVAEKLFRGERRCIVQSPSWVRCALAAGGRFALVVPLRSHIPTMQRASPSYLNWLTFRFLLYERHYKSQLLLLIIDVIYLWHASQTRFANLLHYALLCRIILQVEE